MKLNLIAFFYSDIYFVRTVYVKITAVGREFILCTITFNFTLAVVNLSGPEFDGDVNKNCQ